MGIFSSMAGAGAAKGSGERVNKMKKFFRFGPAGKSRRDARRAVRRVNRSYTRAAKKHGW